MFDLKSIDKIDSQKMYKVYDNWQEIVENAYVTEYQPVSYVTLRESCDSLDGKII